MSDEQPDETYHEGHPVLWGLLALVAVAAVVGVILGGGALAASRVLGLSDDGEASDQSSQEETLVVPRPTETDESTEPSITLAPVPEPAPSSTRPPEPEFAITLESEQTAVGPMEPIDLNGTYAGGDGAILRVQQWQDGAWDDFPVTAPVNGGSFYTYIQASMVGENRFRMLDTDTGEASNEVRVRIG